MIESRPLSELTHCGQRLRRRGGFLRVLSVRHPKGYPQDVRTLSVGATAEALGVSRSSVRRWVKCGLLESFRLPSGHFMITETAVEQFFRRMFGSNRPE